MTKENRQQEEESVDDETSSHPKTSSFPRRRIFQRLREQFRSRRNKKKKAKQSDTTTKKSNNKISQRAAAVVAAEVSSSYDERSILDSEWESRDGPPLDDDVDDCYDDDYDNSSYYEGTFSSVSSQLTSSSNPRSQMRRVSKWKRRMSRSIRRLLRKQQEEERLAMKPAYEDFDLFVHPDEPVYRMKGRQQVATFRELCVPSLSTPSNSREDEEVLSTDAHYYLGDEFPLDPFDSSAWNDVKSLRLDPTGLTAVSTQSMNPEDAQASPVFVSFEDDQCAQLVFEPTDYEEDDAQYTTVTEEYQPLETQSIISDMCSLSDEHGELTYHDLDDLLDDDDDDDDDDLMPLGATYSHPGQSVDSMLKLVSSNDTEETEPGALGIAACGNPKYWRLEDKMNHSNVNNGNINNNNSNSVNSKSTEQTNAEPKKQENHHHQVWSRVEAPVLEGEVTDPPTPIHVETLEANWSLLGPTESTDESEITLSETLFRQKRGGFRSLVSCPPTGLWGSKREQDGEHPYDEPADYATRRKDVTPKTKEAMVDRMIRETLEHYRTNANVNKGDYHADDERDTEWTRTSSDDGGFTRKKGRRCSCIKCTAKAIYRDLMRCNHDASVSGL